MKFSLQSSVLGDGTLRDNVHIAGKAGLHCTSDAPALVPIVCATSTHLIP